MVNERKIFEFIIESGIKLDAKGETISAAVAYCYKFLQRMPTDTTDDTSSSICPYTIASACLVVAGKAEEDFLKLRDVTNVCYRVLNPTKPPLEVDDLYWRIREGVGRAEYFVLRTLAFQLDIEHPHKYMLHYLCTLKDWVPRANWDQRPIVDTAWIILRDAYVRPDFVLKHAPQTIALVCIFITFEALALRVPCVRDWCRILYDGASREHVVEMAKQLMHCVYDEQEL